MPRRDAAPRDLLFGLIALHNDLIGQTDLADALRDPDGRPVADALAATGALDGPRRELVEALTAEHLRRHGGDPGRGLAGLTAGPSTRERLTALGDPELAATLDRVGTRPTPSETNDPDRTPTVAAGRASFGVGTAAADGQRFRVLRPHAKGGLGAVFVALDSELNREVALKQILDRHADDPASRQRFLVEAEITGGLEHPGIVPVYGLGAYDGGRPYYAMRFIRGDSLKEAIERFHAGPALKADPGRRSLELRRLLRRFTDVCNAVEYAHSRGVLHRDLKPGNVIVGKHGETLVVDWGLAKPLGRAEPTADGGERPLTPSSASGSAETLPGSALGTPSYMSPEQAAGDLDKLGPRSDVASLGATLYCLLTGKPPFGGDVLDVLRKVQRGEFAAPRQLDPSVDEALEAVCLKAMALKPEDRYPSCRALAEDVERWTADEPVSAWAEPFPRRTRRWARRNRPLVTAASAAVLVATVGLAAVLVVQSRANADLREANTRVEDANTSLARNNDDLKAGNAREAKANADLREANARVEARFDLAVEAIRLFSAGVQEEAVLGNESLKPTRDKLLRSAAGFYEKLEKLLRGQADRKSRATLAQSYHELGKLIEKIGVKPEALATYRSAVAIRRELAGLPGADAAATLALARSLIAEGMTARENGDTPRGLAALGEARDLATPPATGPGASEEAREVLGQSLSEAAVIHARSGRTAEALASFDRALAIRRELAGRHPDDARFRDALAGSQFALGALLARTGRTADALALYREALAIRKKLAEDYPGDTDSRGALARIHFNTGVVLAQTGGTADALASYREALAIWKKLTEDYPAVTGFRSDLSRGQNGLAAAYVSAGRLDEALASFTGSSAIRKRLAEENPTVISFRSQLADSYNNIGTVLDWTGRPDEALASLAEGLAVRKKLAEDNPTVTGLRGELAMTHNNLGGIQLRAGRTAEALASFSEALAIRKKLAADSPAFTEYRSDLAESYRNVGLVHSRAGRTAEGLASWSEALAIRKKLAADHPAVTRYRGDLAESHDDLGGIYLRAGRAAEALAEYEQERAIYQALAGSDPTVPDYRNGRAIGQAGGATALRALGRLDEARDGYGLATAIREGLVKDHPKVTKYRSGLASGVRQLGLARAAAGDLAGAVADARKALSLYEGLPSRTVEDWFETACVHAALAGLAGSGVPAAEAERKADAAMALLRKAVGLGYRDADAVHAEEALDPLRSRDDFRLLMLDLTFPADPFAAAR